MFNNFMEAAAGSSQKISGKEFNGVIVDNNDPKRLQRCRVRISDLHADIKDEDIPWATKRDASRGTAPGVINVDVPPIGAKVKVTFRDESMYSPTYFGGVFEGENAQAPEEGYPHVILETDHAGNSIRRDTRNGSNTFTFTHVSGTTISIDNAGNVSVSSPQSLTVSTTNNIDIRAGGFIKVQATGNLHLRGASILQNDSKAEAPSTTTPSTRPTIPITENNVDY